MMRYPLTQRLIFLGTLAWLFGFGASLIQNASAAPESSSTVWATQRVISEPTIDDVDLGSSALFVDNSGKRHAVFGKDHLYYATDQSGSWVTEVVDPLYAVGRAASIASAGDGTFHVAYIDDENDALKYTSFDGDSWSDPISIFTEGATINSIDIALDSDGAPVIGLAGERAARVFTKVNGIWQEDTIQNETLELYTFSGGAVSLVIGPNDEVHMIYPSKENEIGESTYYSQLRYAENSSGTWEITLLADWSSNCCTISLNGDMVFTPDGTLHLFHTTANFGPLVYKAISNGKTTESYTLDSYGYRPKATLDEQNRPTVIFARDGKAERQVKTSSGWVTTTYNFSDSFSYSSLSINASGQASLLFGEWNSELIQVVDLNTPSNIDTVGSSLDAGNSTDMVFDIANSQTHIGTATSRGVEYVVLNGTVWEREIAFSSSEYIPDTLAIALNDTTGEPCIVHTGYNGTSPRSIRYSCRSGTESWTTEVIDTIYSHSPYPPDLSFVDGIAHVAYVEAGNASENIEANVKYAVKSGNTWAIDTLFSILPQNFISPFNLSMVVESDGTPHIAFQAIGVAGINYMTKEAAWSRETIEIDTAGSPIIHLDRSGQPILSAFAPIDPSPTTALYFIYKNGDVWETVKSIDVTKGTFKYNAFLDTEGKPHIAYMSDGALNYATYTGNSTAASDWGTSADWTQARVDPTIEGSFNEDLSIATDENQNPIIAYQDRNNGDLKLAWTSYETSIPDTATSLVNAFGMASFEFPAGTFGGDVNLSIELVQPFGDLPNLGIFYDINAIFPGGGTADIQDGLEYTVTIRYDEAFVPAGVNEADLALYYWSGSDWVKEPTGQVDTETNTLTATPNHFSIWAPLFSTENTLHLPMIVK